MKRVLALLALLALVANLTACTKQKEDLDKLESTPPAQAQ